mgnify:CR=1 FL=1
MSKYYMIEIAFNNKEEINETRMIENGSKNKEKITDLFIATVADYNPKSEEAYTIKEMLK